MQTKSLCHKNSQNTPIFPVSYYRDCRCDTREKPFFVFMTIFYAPSCRSNSYTYIAIMRYHPHRGANNTREGLSPPQKTYILQRNITSTLVIFPTKEKKYDQMPRWTFYISEKIALTQYVDIQQPTYFITRTDIWKYKKNLKAHQVTSQLHLSCVGQSIHFASLGTA